MSSSQEPVRILSFDGGGIRGLSSLLILRALMDRLGVKKGVAQTDHIRPSECFDLVIGTGTGGLSAILVGRIGMTADEAIKAYMTVAEAAFEPKSVRNPTLPRIDGVALQHTVEDIVLEFLGDRCVKLEVSSNDYITCHTSVLAARSTYANAPPHIFRSHPNGGPSSPEAISQVICATISDSSSTFRPVPLGNPPINFVDAGISGYNNPVEIALTQAAQIWPDREQIIVSFGTGQQGIVAVDKGLNQVAEVYRLIIQSCEEVHERILRSQLPSYFRFNVDRGLASNVQEWQDENIAAMTDGYMRNWEVEYRLDKCAYDLSGETHMGMKPDFNQEELSIINWLSPLNFKQVQKDIFQRRQEGTGQWFLESDTFKDWLAGKFRVLWCSGMPGSGKTVLTSTVVNHLKAVLSGRKVAIAYIYCNYKEQAEQTAMDLIASVLKQVIQASNMISKDLKALHDTNTKDRTHPTLQELITALKSEILNFTKVYVIIDALDECHESTRLAILQELESLAVTTNLLITSRDWPSSACGFEKIKYLDICADDHDVRCYIAGRVAYTRKPHLRSWEGRIIQKISEKVKGMFLLAQLHMDLLERTQNVAQLRHTLGNLPGRVDDTYDEAMKRIKQQTEEDRNLAKEVLSWITYTHRPLSTTELQYAIAVTPGTTDIDLENITDEKTLLSVCAGLVVIDKERNIIHLVHYTTQQYFGHKGDIHFPNAQAQITAKCLAYLSFDRFAIGYCNTYSKLESLLEDNPLLDYAARHWGAHARFCQSEKHCRNMAVKFLNTSPNIPLVSQVMLVGPENFWSRWFSTNLSGMHLAAFFGLDMIMEYQLRESSHGSVSSRTQHNAKVNSKDGNGRTPLSWAAEWGHKAVVQLLISQNDVKVNSKDKSKRTPLSWAARRGHEEVVQLLVSRDDVVVDLKDQYGKTPLLQAAEQGHEAVMQLLLSRDDVNINSKDENEMTPLLQAAERRHKAVIQLLLLRDDVKMNSKDKNGRTPLSWAAKQGHEEGVQLLLSRDDVKVNSKDDFGQTPLSLAAKWGHKAVMQLLILRDDIKVNSRDKKGRTPLSRAAEQGHEEVVQLLLSRDDIMADLTDKFGQTPLLLAAKQGHKEVVRLLVSRDDIVADSKDQDGRTPLSWAVIWRHEEVVRLLISRGDIMVDSKDMFGWTPLSLADSRGYKAIEQMLIAAQATKVTKPCQDL